MVLDSLLEQTSLNRMGSASDGNQNNNGNGSKVSSLLRIKMNKDGQEQHESSAAANGNEESHHLRDFQERQQMKYCYPFKEYDPTGTNSRNRMTHNNQASQIGTGKSVGDDPFLHLNGLRRATISQGTSHHLLLSQGHHHQIRSSSRNLISNNQNVPPPPLPECEPPPLPPKRTTSLFGGGGNGMLGNSATLTLLRLPKARESSSLNPKRISIATSTFWTGHPDMAHFASGWEIGQTHENRTHSVWGTTERGGRPVTESVDIWGDPPAVKKGVLLQQREKLWSRWKERYFILTRDYLNCFRRTTSVHRSGVRLSEMGSFIYKLRLAEVEDIEWETRKNGSLVALLLPQEPKILLKVPDENYEALHQWFTLLQECIYMSKERRRALRIQHGSTARSSFNYNPSSSNKSVGSASPNSSSTKSASNSDLDKTSSDGGGGDTNNTNSKVGSLQKNNGSSGGLLSAVRNSSKKCSESPKLMPSSGRGRHSFAGNNGKYSPLIDDDEEDGELEEEEDDDVEDELLAKLTGPPPPQFNSSRSNSSQWPVLPPGDADGSDPSQEEFTVTLRRRRGEINNNNCSTISNTWKLSNSNIGGGGCGGLIGSSRKGQFGNVNNVRHNNENSNNGYATPVDAMKPTSSSRPGSWTPQPSTTMFYRTSSLVPSQWINKRDLISNNHSSNSNCSSRVPNFGRSSVIYCPSQVTADVTFRKMS